MAHAHRLVQVSGVRCIANSDTNTNSDTNADSNADSDTNANADANSGSKRSEQLDGDGSFHKSNQLVVDG